MWFRFHLVCVGLWPSTSSHRPLGRRWEMFDPEFEWCLLTDEPGAKARTGGSLHSGNRNQRETVRGHFPALAGAHRRKRHSPEMDFADPPQVRVSAKSISGRMHLRCVRNQPPQHRPTMLACSARPQSGLVKSRRKGPLRYSARSQRTRLGASVNQAALVPRMR